MPYRTARLTLPFRAELGDLCFAPFDLSTPESVVHVLARLSECTSAAMDSELPRITPRNTPRNTAEDCEVWQSELRLETLCRLATSNVAPTEPVRNGLSANANANPACADEVAPVLGPVVPEPPRGSVSVIVPLIAGFVMFAMMVVLIVTMVTTTPAAVPCPCP